MRYPRLYLEEQIRKALRRWRTGLLIRGLAMMLAVAALGASALMVMKPMWLTRPWLVPVVGGLVLLTELWILFFHIIRPLRRKIPLSAVARSIERKHPELEDRLVTAVELSEKQRAAMDAWVERLIRDAVQHISNLSLPKQVQVKGYFAWQTLLLASAVALVSSIWLKNDWTPDLKQLAGRGFKTPKPVPELTVEPGDTRLQRGKSLEVRAFLQNLEAEQVRVFYTREDSVWQTEIMSGSEAGADYRFTFFDIQAPFRYYVEAGEEISDIFRVDVYDAPDIRRIDLTYFYPKAIGLPRKHVPDGGDIWAPAGTRVRIRVISTWPVEKAEFLLGERSPVPMQLLNDTTAVYDIRVRKDNFYRIRLISKEGLDNAPLTEYYIQAVPNQKPILTLRRPGRDYKATMLEEVPIEAEVTDDFGLQAVTLKLRVNSDAEISMPLKRQPIEAEKDSDLSLKTLKYSAMLYLEDLQVQPGDFITYYLQAQDAGLPPVLSELYFIEIRNFDNVFKRATSQGGAGGGFGPNLAQMQKEIIIATNKLIRQRSQFEEALYKEYLEDLHESQEKLRKSVEQINRQARMRMKFVPDEDKKVLEFLDRAILAMKEAEPLIQNDSLRAALTPERTAFHYLLKADALTRERQISTSRSAGAPANTDELTQLFRDEMDRLKSKYETLQQGDRQSMQQQMDEALQKIRELARRQQRLNDLNRQLARSHLTEEEKRREIKKLQRQQEQLNRDMQQAMRQMSNMMRQSGMGDPEALRRMQQASNAMNRAMNRLRRQDLQNAASSGQQALNQLKTLEDRLKKTQQNALRNELQQLQSEIQQLAQQQAALKEKSREMRQPGQLSREALEKQIRAQDELRQRTEEAVQKLQELAQGTRNHPKLQRELQKTVRELQRQKPVESMRQSELALRAGRLRIAEHLQEKAEEALKSGSQKIRESLASLGNSPEEKLETALQKTQNLRRQLEQRLQAQAGEGKPSQQPEQQAGRAGQQQGSSQPGHPPTGGERLTEQKMREWRDLLWQAQQQLQDVQNQISQVDTSLSRRARQLGDQIRGIVRTFRGSNPNRMQAIQNQIIDPLRRLEAELAMQLQLMKNQETFRTVLDEDLPPKYREYIEAYYRSLSKERQN